MFSVIYAQWHKQALDDAECRYAECRYAECGCARNYTYSGAPPGKAPSFPILDYD